jgi:hypothetical protein
MGTGRYNLMGNGSQTDALAAGGAISGTAKTFSEGYNGTSWATRPSLGTAQYRGTGPGAAPATLGIVVGGYPTPNHSTTQEFTGETTAANVTDFSTE